MPYVERNNGAVVGLYANKQPGYAEEWLADDAAEVVAFRSPPPAQSDYSAAIQAHVNATAVSRLFHDGATLASYVTSTNPQWAAEAQAFVAWRDAVWAYAYTEMDKVLNGQRPQPTVTEIIAELPPISWPA